MKLRIKVSWARDFGPVGWRLPCSPRKPAMRLMYLAGIGIGIIAAHPQAVQGQSGYCWECDVEAECVLSNSPGGDNATSCWHGWVNGYWACILESPGECSPGWSPPVGLLPSRPETLVLLAQAALCRAGLLARNDDMDEGNAGEQQSAGRRSAAPTGDESARWRPLGVGLGTEPDESL